MEEEIRKLKFNVLTGEAFPSMSYQKVKALMLLILHREFSLWSKGQWHPCSGQLFQRTLPLPKGSTFGMTPRLLTGLTGPYLLLGTESRTYFSFAVPQFHSHLEVNCFLIILPLDHLSS